MVRSEKEPSTVCSDVAPNRIHSSPKPVVIPLLIIDSPEVDPENAKLARARREAAFMGKEEGARHIIKSLGKVETTFEPGSLFAELNVSTTGQSKI